MKVSIAATSHFACIILLNKSMAFSGWLASHPKFPDHGVPYKHIGFIDSVKNPDNVIDISVTWNRLKLNDLSHHKRGIMETISTTRPCISFNRFMLKHCFKSIKRLGWAFQNAPSLGLIAIQIIRWRFYFIKSHLNTNTFSDSSSSYVQV